MSCWCLNFKSGHRPTVHKHLNCMRQAACWLADWWTAVGLWSRLLVGRSISQLISLWVWLQAGCRQTIAIVVASCPGARTLFANLDLRSVNGWQETNPIPRAFWAMRGQCSLPVLAPCSVSLLLHVPALTVNQQHSHVSQQTMINLHRNGDCRPPLLMTTASRYGRPCSSRPLFMSPWHP